MTPCKQNQPLVTCDTMQSSQVAAEHYKDLKDKPFFPALKDYILSGPVVGMVGGVTGWE